MNIDINDINILVHNFLWVLFRVAGMCMAIPVIGTKMVSKPIRMFLALAITVVLFPMVKETPLVSIFSLTGILIVASQIMIGVIIGFVFQIVFQTFIIGGQIIAMQTGLGFAMLADPQSGVNVPVIGQLYLMLVTLIFLAINGHLIIISVLADSFNTIPISIDFFSRVDLWQFILWSKWLFSGAVIMALPAIVTLLLVNFSFGIMTKAAPQLNIFAVGFPITMLLGLIILGITLSTIVYFSDFMFGKGFEQLNHMILGVR